VKKSFNIQELFAQQVKTPWNQTHAPLLVKSFPKTPKNDLKHPSSVDLIFTKQSKLPSFIDRCFAKDPFGSPFLFLKFSKLDLRLPLSH